MNSHQGMARFHIRHAPQQPERQRHRTRWRLPRQSLADDATCRAAYTPVICETPTGRTAMNEHVYKTIEITGSSHKGPEDAIRLAIGKASQTVKNMRWFKVVEMRGNIDNGKIEYWQVTLDLGFTLE